MPTSFNFTPIILYVFKSSHCSNCDVFALGGLHLSDHGNDGHYFSLYYYIEKIVKAQNVDATVVVIQFLRVSTLGHHLIICWEIFGKIIN